MPKRTNKPGVRGRVRKMSINKHSLKPSRRSSRLAKKREQKTMNNLLSGMTSLKVSSPPKRSRKAGKRTGRKVKSRRTKKVERKPQTLEDLMSSLRL